MTVFFYIVKNSKTSKISKQKAYKMPVHCPIRDTKLDTKNKTKTNINKKFKTAKPSTAKHFKTSTDLTKQKKQ